MLPEVEYRPTAKEHIQILRTGSHQNDKGLYSDATGSRENGVGLHSDTNVSRESSVGLQSDSTGSRGKWRRIT